MREMALLTAGAGRIDRSEDRGGEGRHRDREAQSEEDEPREQLQPVVDGVCDREEQ